MVTIDKKWRWILARLLDGKGSAYIASAYANARFPQDARKELDQATRLTQLGFRTRQSYNAVRYAQAFFVEKNYPMAVSYSEHALSLVKEIGSEKNLAFLEALYKGLRLSPFGKDVSVAQFGVELLKVQKP